MKLTVEPFEVALGVLGVGFSFILFVFPGVFDAPLYGLMSIAPPVAWGVLFAVGSMVRLTVIFSDGERFKSYQLRLLASIGAATFIWLPFVVSFWWFAALKISGGDGQVLPGVVLSVGMLFTEIRCALALKEEI